LLEEPQAVFYDWLWRERHHLADHLKGIRLVLVVDLGGGTLDLTLISVKETESGPEFTRIAVGQHLMLGGDNLDLSLAHLAEGKLASAGHVVTPLEFSQLVEQCRQAKEVLLSNSAPQKVKVTLLGGGSRLIGGARSVDFDRSEVQSLLMEGFFRWSSSVSFRTVVEVGLSNTAFRSPVILPSHDISQPFLQSTVM